MRVSPVAPELLIGGAATSPKAVIDCLVPAPAPVRSMAVPAFALASVVASLIVVAFTTMAK